MPSHTSCITYNPTGQYYHSLLSVCTPLLRTGGLCDAVLVMRVELCEWLAVIGDEKLQQQVGFVDELLKFSRDCDECAGKWSAADTRDARQLSREWAAVVMLLSGTPGFR